jgi:copper homeostasis protein
MTCLLEVCAGSLQSALNAQAGGAHRIELCDNLNEGGTTPSPGIIRQAVKLLDIPVFVLIRPRPGDFLYSDEEFEAMRQDIMHCKEQGAKGIVVGILCADGTVDVERMTELVRLARPMQVTFHRAFDMVDDPWLALEEIISLSCDRILTSGQASTAIAGAGLISALVSMAAERILIMPGSGITENNALELIRMTGVKEIHASLRSPVPSAMKFRNDRTSMGSPGSDEFSRMETDPSRVRKILSLLESTEVSVKNDKRFPSP